MRMSNFDTVLNSFVDNIDDFEDPAGITKTILAAAKDSASRLDWAAIRQAAKDRNGIPVAITR